MISFFEVVEGDFLYILPPSMRQYRVWRNMFGVVLSKAEAAAFKVQETHSHTRIGQIDFQIVGKGSREIDARLRVNEKETSCALGIKRSASNVMMRLALMSPIAGALLSNV